MKKILLLIILTFSSLILFSQTGSTCEDAIPVDEDFLGSFGPGEYWFTATTYDLPLQVYYYPEDTLAKWPDIYIDLTCTPGIYEDSIVSRLVKLAGWYSLEFPMKENPRVEYIDGRRAYVIVYDESYRNLLYNEGGTYPIPAYIRIVNYTNATVEIRGNDEARKCRNTSISLTMNTALPLTPDDSLNMYLWPIGDWVYSGYKITWEGDKGLELYESTKCDFTRMESYINKYSMPKDTIKMGKRQSIQLVKERNTLELYLRLYPQSPGILHIESLDTIARITKFVVDGIPAAIDQDALTITCLLPEGTARTTAIRKAQIEYTSLNGEAPVFNTRLTTVTIGNTVYTINVTINSGNTESPDASLKWIKINGNDLEGFNPSKLEYDDVEIVGNDIRITAQTSAQGATHVIHNASSIPGKAKIEVTAKAGNRQTYVLNLIPARNRDASLKQIMINGIPLANFNPDVYTYNIDVLLRPEVTATVNNSLSTATILQASRVPGYSQILVKAEAGNMQTYTIYFHLDKSIEECADQTEELTTGKWISVSSTGNEVYKMPLQNFSGRNVRMLWQGTKPMTVFASVSCNAPADLSSDMLISSFTIQPQKGVDIMQYIFTQSELITLSRKSIDGNVYLRFAPQEQALFSVEQFTPTCVTRSTLLDLPQQENTSISVNLASNGFTKIYSLYLPDWQKKDIEISWTGASTLELFIADTCDFYLQQTNIHLLAEGYRLLASGQSITITQGVAEGWLNRCGNFAYMRALNGANGTLTITIKKDYNHEEPIVKNHYLLTLCASPAQTGFFTATETSGQQAISQTQDANGNIVFTFEEGAQVSFAAQAAEHYSFRSWTDGLAQNPRQVTMNTNKEYTALFVADKYTLTVSCDPKQGRVSGSGRYNYLTEVKIEARANRGYIFDSWSDGEKDNPRTIIIENDREIEALFRADDTAIENANSYPSDQPHKIIRNNEILILMPDGRTFNLLGQETK